VDKLAVAIGTATTDLKMKAQAATLGKAIRAEDGLGTAMKIIQQYLGEST
jgi:hypothetical protein